MVDKQSIDTTFNRIEKSLDLRFQKKGTLYITKEDLELVKKSLYQDEFQNFLALGTKVGMPVLMQVLFKNPWLINSRALRDRELKKQLKNTLGENTSKQYLTILRQIVEDNVFSTLEFKSFIENYYYTMIDYEECSAIYQDDRKKPEVRAICFLRDMEISEERGSFIIREIDDMFMSNADLYKVVKDKPALSNLMKNISEKDDVAEWILDNKVYGKIDSIWTNALIALGKEGFIAGTNYIKNNDMDYDEVTKWLIRKVFPKFFLYAKDDTSLIDEYINHIMTIYNDRRAYRIKVLFLDMLEPSKFKNQELAMRLLDRFKISGIDDRYRDRVANIRKWEDNENGYSNVMRAYEKLTAENQDFSKKGTLNFTVMQFKKTDYEILEQLLENYGREANVVKALSYFIADELKNNNMALMNKVSLSDNYVDQITEYIDEYRFNGKLISNFLHTNNKHAVLARIERR